MERFGNIWRRKLHDNSLPALRRVRRVPIAIIRVAAILLLVFEDRRYDDARQRGRFEEELEETAVDSWLPYKRGLGELLDT